MTPESELEYYAENPEQLLDLCRQVLERLSAGTGGETAKQLQAVSAAIEQLQKQDIPVPEGLRAEKLRLAAAQTCSEEAAGKLRAFVDGLEQLARPYFSKSRRQQESMDAPKVRRKSREEAKVTDKATLRGLIIDILRSHGGSAKVSDVLDDMEERLQGKLLPGDLVPRQGKESVMMWRNNAQWERLRMVKEGILRNDSPHGIWELSDQYK